MICPECDGEGCPYCGGPDRDYHTMCFDCAKCGGTGVVQRSTKDLIVRGFIQGATFGLMYGFAQEILD